MKKPSLNYDAGIILGGGRYDENILTPLSKMRLDKGWELYNQGIIPKIILPGSNYGTYIPKATKFEKTTAKLRKEYLLAKGSVKDEAIILAEEGRDTIYEAFAVRKKAKELGLKNLLLITSERHMPRAFFIFKSIFGSDLKVYTNKLSEVVTGNILIGDEEKEYLSLVKELFSSMPETIPQPDSWENWYSEHLDFYSNYKRIHDRFHPPGKESQAYTLGAKKIKLIQL
ncbi:MAG: YdcF family protein [Candidatus Woykebacteria bacterium]